MTELRRSDGTAVSTDVFLAELRELRVRAGQPSFRRLSQIADQRLAASPPENRPEPLPPSTVSEVLGGKRLPRLPRWAFVESYVAACLHAGGADEPAVADELTRWRERWRELAVEEEPPRAEPPGRPARRWMLAAAMAGVFLLGVGAGVIGVARRSAPTVPMAGPEPVTTSDECVASATPAGRDLLGARAWRLNNSSLATLNAHGGQLDATVPGGSRSPTDVLIILNVSIVQGHTYALAFTTVADRDATIRLRVQEDRPPIYPESLFRDLEVGQSACRRFYRFTGARSNPRSELTFQVGGLPDRLNLRVSDILLVEE